MSQVTPESLQFIADDAIGNHQKLTARIVEAITEDMKQGNEDPFKFWCPDRIRRSISERSDARNTLAAKAHWIAQSIEVSVLKYLQNLARGFVSDEANKCYFPSGVEASPVPVIHRPEEMVFCVNELLKLVGSDFANLSTTIYTDQGKGFVQGDGAMVDFLVKKPRPGEVEALFDSFKFNINKLDLAWKAELSTPRVWATDTKLEVIRECKPGQRDELAKEHDQLWVWNNELLQEQRRLLGLRNRGVQVFADYSDKLQNDIESNIPDRIKRCDKEPENIAKAFDAVVKKEGVTYDERKEALEEAKGHFKQNALTMAWLTVKERFTPHLKSLYQVYKQDPLEKLTACIKLGESNQSCVLGADAPISIRTISELRYNLAFLNQHLKAYCKQEAKARLAGSKYVDHTGEHRALTKEELALTADYVVKQAMSRLFPWLRQLAPIDLAESKRAQVVASFQDYEERLGKELEDVLGEDVNFSAHRPMSVNSTDSYSSAISRLRRESSESVNPSVASYRHARQMQAELQRLAPIREFPLNRSRGGDVEDYEEETAIARGAVEAARSGVCITTDPKEAFKQFNRPESYELVDLVRQRAVSQRKLSLHASAAERAAKAYNAWFRYQVREQLRLSEEKYEYEERIYYIADLLGMEPVGLPSFEGLSEALGGHVSVSNCKSSVSLVL